MNKGNELTETPVDVGNFGMGQRDIGRQIKRYSRIVLILWVVLVGLSLTYSVMVMRGVMLELAKTNARSAFDMDILFRRWNAMHGGVYAPVSEHTPSNPYLDVPDRDVVTIMGQQLTKINPSYMTRQVHELAELENGIQGYITSLKPIRPENHPDSWERESLLRFEKGELETSAIRQINGTRYMHLMRPLFMEQACLQCHEEQGYKLGQVRGGISIAVPLAPLETITRGRIWPIVCVHLLLLVAGYVGTLTGTRLILRRLEKQQEAEHALMESQIQTKAANQKLQLALAEMKILAEEAVAAGKAKSDFLANMSHEIRTPLNGIIGMADLIAKTTMDPKQHRYIQIIRESGDGLLGIINDILDISKIEAGKVVLEAVKFNLRSIVTAIGDMLALKTHEKGLTFQCRIDSDIPVHLTGDPGRLRQVLVNLVVNAVKFTETGGVTLDIHREAEDSNSVRLKFSVMDTGIGIAQHQLKHLFKPFIQADTSTTRKYGGTGLGLSISSQFVEMMGGKLDVDSTEGKGSHFHFTLSFKKRPPTEEEAGEDYTMGDTGTFISAKTKTATADDTNETNLHPHPITVLLVEDNEVNRLVEQEMLEKSGYNVLVAEDGAQAVEMVKNQSPDIILMDCLMPVMDGYQTTREIRKLEAQKENQNNPVPIIAVTASAMKGEMEKCREAGMDDYMAKPIKIEILVDKIRRLLKNTAQINKNTEQTLPSEPDEQINESMILDEAEFNKRFCGDHVLQLELYRAFLKQIPTELSNLKEAVEMGDGARVRFHTHRINGSATNICAPNCKQAAREMEAAAQAQQKERFPELLERLELQLMVLTEVLKKKID